MMTFFATIGVACRPISSVQRIEVLIDVLLQIDDAAVAEALDAIAGARVERDHLIARRHVDDAFVVAVLPVREPAARELPRRDLAALAFVEPMDPEQLAVAGVERDDGAARARRRVDDAVDHQRRRLKIELAIRPEAIGLEAPRDLEAIEVARVDLVERRVARVAEIAAVGRPLAARRAALRQCERRRYGQTDRDPGPQVVELHPPPLFLGGSIGLRLQLNRIAPTLLVLSAQRARHANAPILENRCGRDTGCCC